MLLRRWLDKYEVGEEEEDEVDDEDDEDGWTKLLEVVERFLEFEFVVLDEFDDCATFEPNKNWVWLLLHEFVELLLFAANRCAFKTAASVKNWNCTSGDDSGVG